jgi:predicted ATPase
MLLLLDNLEQLLPEVAGIVASLDTQILATSRERLNVASEQEYEVPTLSIDDAVALFTQRARQLKPKFDPDLYVTEIVRRLDGLPLAVELAAARAKLLSAKEIAFRLESGLDFLGGGARDRPERQQTLRAAIAWSHELLSEADQRHFSSVAVFSGSFGLDAAEAVAGLNLDALASLVDKSLLRRTEDDRFFQLETIREYARERLAARRDAAELQQRHAGWFLRLAEEIGPGLRGPAQASLLDQLEREVNNLRTAARWYRSQDPVLGVRLATASWRFWFMHGRVTEGRRLLEAAISQADALPSELRAEALTALSRFTGFQGDLELAEAQTREALAIYRSVSNGRGVAFALHSLAIIAAERGGYAESARLEEEARSLGEQLGDEVVVTNAISGLATLALDQSDSIRAEELYAEALTRCRKLGDAYGVATGLSGIALAALQREDYDGALPPLVESIGLAQELGWTENYVYTLEALSCLAAARGERRAAARLLGCAEALREGIGAPVRPFERALHNRALAAVRSTLESDVLEAEWSAGRAMSPEVAVRSGLETASVASVD